MKTTARGFSTIETLVATALFTAALVGLFAAVGTAGLHVYFGGRESLAGEQAQAMVARIRNAASFQDLLSYADDPARGAATPRPGYVEDNRVVFRSVLHAGGIAPDQARITVSEEGTAPNRLARISVSVDWPGRIGTSAPTFVTHIAEW
jgi:hypothetical protein